MASAGHQESPLPLPAGGITSASATSKPASNPNKKRTSDPWKLPGQFPCSVCGVVIKHRSNFKRHTALHQRGKTLKCSKCDEVFHDRYALRVHMKRAHVAPEVLETGVTRGGRLESQGEMLNRRMTAECSTCGKLFRNRYCLRIHWGRKKYAQCAPKALETGATCGGRLKSQREMLHHSRDKVSTFPCDICRRKFQTAVVRAAHRRRHFWRGLPRCRVCSATFACEQHLSRHIRNHESETSEPVRY